MGTSDRVPDWLSFQGTREEYEAAWAAAWHYEMPDWEREKAARTEADLADGTAPPDRPDDIAELEARIARLHEQQATPVADGDLSRQADGAATDRVADADWRVGDAEAAGRSVVDVAALAADAEWERRNAEFGRSVDEATDRSESQSNEWWYDDPCDSDDDGDVDDRAAVR